MGVRTLHELRAEVAERRGRRSQLIGAINLFCRDRYGVRNYREMVKPYITPNRLGVCLARQIPTANVEHIALHLFAQWLCHNDIPADPMPLSVVKDSYLASNAGKKAAIKIPFLERNGSSGSLKRSFKEIVDKKGKRNIDGRVLSTIVTKEGLFLPGYHAELRKRVFGHYGVTMDLTDFFMELLADCAQSECSEKPKTIFLETHNRAWQVPFSLERFANGTRPRPPAEWYYVPYLMLFVTGEWALVSTVDDDAEASDWFAHSIKVITEACGIGPLIIDSPKEVSVFEYHSDLLEIPKRFIEQSLEVVQPFISWPEGGDLFLVMEDLERKIIQMA